MSNDPYSWFNIDRLDQMIKKEKEEFKKKEEEKDDTSQLVLLGRRTVRHRIPASRNNDSTVF